MEPERYFGFRLMYKIYGSRVKSAYQKLVEMNKENPNPRFEMQNKEIQKSYKGWEKLHAAFKHYKGLFL